jgi:hypothetical protein
MEVHHPHHPTHKKKWKEYLLEFFMLFLAVSLGFIAENIREEQVIKHQTSTVLAQLKEELKVDTANISNLKGWQAKFDTATEFVTYLIRKDQLKGNERNFYILNNFLTLRAGMFETNCIAIDQLKNAGLLKNIKEREVSEAIEIYDRVLVTIAKRTNREQEYMNQYIDELKSVPFDYYKPYDPDQINFNSVTGKTYSKPEVNCNNTKIVLSKVFIPDNLTMKTFDKSSYLNKIAFLGVIRNSTKQLYFDTAYNRATRLIMALDKYYPHASE